jgi:uncharacterized protein
MKPDNRQALIEMVHLVEKKHGGAVALGEAVRWSLTKEITRLLDAGVAVDARIPPNDSTPLMLANKPAVAKMLVTRGADVNARDMNGRTPLHCFLLALFKPKIAKDYLAALVELGADVAVVSNEGEIPTALAMGKYGEEVASLLGGTKA